MLLIVKFMELTKFLKNRIASAASDPTISLMGRFVQAYFFLRGQYYRTSTRGIIMGESWKKREKSVRSTFPVPSFYKILVLSFSYAFNFLSTSSLRQSLLVYNLYNCIISHVQQKIIYYTRHILHIVHKCSTILSHSF